MIGDQGSGIGDRGSGIGDQGGIKNLHAIVFDFDGVIADSERLHLRAYQDILAPEGITMSNEDYFNRYLGYDDVGVLSFVGQVAGAPVADVDGGRGMRRRAGEFSGLPDLVENFQHHHGGLWTALAAKPPDGFDVDLQHCDTKVMKLASYDRPP